jgi:Recombinase
MLTLDRVRDIIEDHRENLADTPVKRTGFSPENLARVHDAANKAKRANALAAHRDLVGPMRELRQSGMSYSAIAAAVNSEGITTRRGAQWDAANVRRIIRLYADSVA